MSTMREMGPVEAENQELRKRVVDVEDENRMLWIACIFSRDESEWRREALELIQEETSIYRSHTVKGHVHELASMGLQMVDTFPYTEAPPVPRGQRPRAGKSTPAPAFNLDMVREVRACLDTLQDNIERGVDPDWFNVAWSSLRNLLQVFLNEVEVEAAVKGEPAMVRCEECGDSWPAGQGLGCDCRERILRQQAERA